MSAGSYPVAWLLAGAAEVPADGTWLDAGEAERARGFRFPRRRADWLLGRWTAKRALAAWAGLQPGPDTARRISLRPSHTGAPGAFLDGAPWQVAVTLSHRCGQALCAVGPPPGAVGCDLEEVTARGDTFVEDYFTPAERALVAAALPADRALAASLIWSAKESALKALGIGLRADTREVEVGLALPAGTAAAIGAGWAPLEVGDRAGGTFNGWWMRTGDLVATLVARPAPALPCRLAS